MTEHVARKANTPQRSKAGQSAQSSLRGIANKAKEQPEYQFGNLYGMIDKELLHLAWGRLNKKAAAGVDRVTAQEYGKDLEANLDDLVARVIRQGYRAKLVKRKHIPKGDGKTRPLGIPTLEDRLLQKAVSMILEAIYEPTFLDCSHGYRPGRDPKTALKDLRDALQFGNYTTVVEADIKGFFNCLDHEILLEMMSKRIKDRKLFRLIRKWLKAGILEPEGMVVNPLTGTPQGGIVSPILANVYLHYGLDLWMEKVVRSQVSGKVKYVRYADDFVCAFENEEDAKRFHKHLPGRLAKFGLEVAEEKTRILRFAREGGPGNRKFDFLGFELSWAKGRKGKPNVKRRTSRKRIQRAKKAIYEWIRTNRSTKLSKLIEEVNAKLRGHYAFYGVIGNLASLGAFFHHVNRLLFKWLNRRSQKKSMNWSEFQTRVRARLISPRITERAVLQRPLPGIRS